MVYEKLGLLLLLVKEVLNPRTALAVVIPTLFPFGPPSPSCQTFFSNTCTDVSVPAELYELGKLNSLHECLEKGISTSWGIKVCHSAGGKKKKKKYNEGWEKLSSKQISKMSSVSKDQALGLRWQLGNWLLNRILTKVQGNTFRVNPP